MRDRAPPWFAAAQPVPEFVQCHNPHARQAHPKRAVSAGRRHCKVGQSNHVVGLTWHNPNPAVLVEGPEVGIRPVGGCRAVAGGS